MSLGPPKVFRRYIEWLHRQNWREHESFWRAYLAGFSMPTTLPGSARDAMACGVPTAVREISLQLEAAQWEAVTRFAARHGQTRATLAQAAWGFVLSRYCGEAEVVFGVTVAGRSGEVPGVASVVGLCINTIPVRVVVDPTRETLSWLAELQRMQHDLREHECTPLAQIQAWSEVGASNQLFDTLLVFENLPLQGLHATNVDGLHIRPVRVVERTNYPLTVIVVPAETLTARFVFDPDCCSESVARRLAEDFLGVLQRFSDVSTRTLGDVRSLSDSQSHIQLVDWNVNARPFDTEACLHELVERQANETPDSVAVCDGVNHLSYRALDQAANARAHAVVRELQQTGRGEQARVGICCERTVETVVGVLAVLKAGAAYVPIDPAYPAARIHDILQSSGVSVAMVDPAARMSLSLGRANVSFIDIDATTVLEPQKPKTQAWAENIAYVIYTSGSTGRPKGVAVQHRNAVSLVSWATDAFTCEELRKVLAGTSLSFDLSIFEMFAPLCVGGTVVLLRDVLALLASPQQFEISMINTVPSAMRELLACAAVPASVVAVNLAGEPLEPALVDAIYEQTEATCVRDLYGPSECTTYSTVTVREPRRPASIGRPIANTTAYVVNDDLQPVAPSVAGELLLGGAGVARGYWGRPDLTAERFVPDPFGKQPGARLYRTGDVCRFNDDGTIMFLGRSDFQVKRRGYRIELGEIEAVLTGHATVDECVVCVAERPEGEAALVAYVTGAENADGTENALREVVRDRLPSCMVPDAIVRLDALPRMQNGKVDRKHLAARVDRDQPTATASSPCCEAQSDTEAQLATIWCELLHVDAVFRNDNFFELGGHSLVATRLMQRIHREFDVEMGFQTLLSSPVLADLAALVDALLQTRQHAVPSVPQGNDHEVFEI